MTSERWRKAKDIFADAADLAEEQRAAFLDRACAGDPALQHDVEELLTGDRKTTAEFLDAGLRPDVLQDLVTQIGRYRILETLGEGGMGRIYLAQQTEPVARRVALKLIKLGMDTQQVLARFEAERQALAMMEHDNIAKVFDAGTTEAGQPYFVMEHVPGMPLRDYCDQHHLGRTRRLELFLQVCAGVQHAHQKGVIHRDLKPQNILVTEQQGRPVPKIIDFGIAKATDQRGQDPTQLTVQGQVIGTPDYMSPEQADGSSTDIDTRSDVYSLGVILHELLTGELPVRTAQDRDPQKPSMRFRELRGDLDWIILKALEEDRERRYPTPISLAEDITRHLADEPVHAGPPGTSYRIQKFMRRHRLQVAAAGAVLLTLLAGIASTTFFMFDAEAKATDAATHLGNYNLLANVVKLDEAQAVFDDPTALYPAWPDKIEAMTRWIVEDAEPLQQELATLQRVLEELRRRATTPSTGREWGFTDKSDQFLRDALARLVERLVVFLDPKTGALERVRARLVWAKTVTHRTVTAPAVAAAWKRAGLQPQLGLVPLGKNPKTGLWEFYHLRSAADPDKVPVHDKAGNIQVDDGTGIVFVLVPAGRFLMGAQNKDPEKPNYDAQAKPHELLLHEVVLTPYFIARHELTQGQWLRLSGGENPSTSKPGWDRPDDRAAPVTLAHPVEAVSWNRCRRLLMQHGLDLPTDAEWERGCRGGQTTAWSTGRDPASLAGHANLRDQTATRAVAQWGRPEAFDDGYIHHAPVGSFQPNGFGLFDVHGNVWEWCRGRKGTSATPYLVCGGNYRSSAANARAALRLAAPPDSTGSGMGARAARKIK